MAAKENYRRSSIFPKTLSQCIEPVTMPVFKTQGLAGSRIISEWATIAGNKLSDHCIPNKLSFPAGKKTDGTLSIAVENGFAPELQHMQKIIIDRIASYFGYKAVTRIIISHTYTAEAEKPVLANLKKLPCTCIDIVNVVDDEELRNALSKVAKTLSGLK